MMTRPKLLSSLCVVLLFLVSACATNPPTSRIVTGAAIGAVVGGAAGCGIGYARAESDRNTSEKKAFEIGCPAGVVGGAIIGAAIAAATYQPPPSPPPAVVAAAPPPPPPPPPPAPKEKLVLRGVHFDFDKSNIRPEDEPVLDEAASTLKAQPGVRVYVDGYCDSIGKDEYNLKLSERRAASVAKYLETAGISADRLTPRGFGKTNFVASNDTDQGRAQNRRVELVPLE